MQTNRSFLKFGVAAAALSLSAAGGYAVHAAAGPGGAVNAQPVAPVTGAAPASFADIVQRVAPAVVSIEVEGKAGPHRIVEGLGGGDGDDDDAPQGLPPELRRFFQQGPSGGQAPAQPMRAAGSGFFIAADGYLVTNNHVVENADKITVHTSDDRTFKARIVGRDPATDLAVLKVEGTNLPFVSFEDRAKPRVGDWVVAVGNPFNLGGTATAGIVSALGRKNLSESSYVDYMQIDAPINRGNSGGPTFDLSGRVVGVNTMIFSPTGGSVGIGFDIPADVVAQVSKQLISTGKVSRGFIGASVQDVTSDIAESLGVKDKGALVAEVTPDGPSAMAGLKPGDMILKVNGQPIASASDLTRAVGMAKAGDTIHLEVRRDGQVRDIAVRSGLRPSEEAIALNGRGAGPGGGDAEADGRTLGALGLQIAPDLQQGGGVRVAGVDGGSDAAQKGLKRGDLILRVGDRATNTPADLKAAVADAKKSGKKSVLLFVARGGVHTFIPVEIGEG
ncbi:Do family serine endopeptidase [Phenylobacterium sp.]|uniref:Do family serine endopeptidase n=1 Tax=Phenylobacterium sp. TaxID=1871053 RepID=UPI0011FCE030|nr:Do family serine endopeptidase [Phenylobacterium sp.]THD64671.1 MAG: Do family serine endopeptidase [Phenylobacterium sp.]